MNNEPSNPLTSVAPLDDNLKLPALLKHEAYAKRFRDVLGERAPQFVSSLISIGNTMPDVQPKSIIGSAMIAAALDLPIDKNLGFAWIIPYRDGNTKVAQFQMGYKGWIQLGLRSAQYLKLNATPINKEVFKGWDAVGEPLLDWDTYDPEKEVWGYFFGFQLVNGFTKTAVWTKEKVREHARRYSQSFRKNADIWVKEFDGMALKTVISNTLRKWGPLSIQMQTAAKADQAVILDIDAEPKFIDGNEADAAVEKPVLEHPAKQKQMAQDAAKEAEAKAAAEAAKAKLAAAAAAMAPKSETKPDEEKELGAMGLAPEPKPENVVTMPPKEETKPAPVTTTEAAPVDPAQQASEGPKEMTENQKQLKKIIEDANYQFEDLLSWGIRSKLLPDRANPTSPKRWEDIPDKKAGDFVRSAKGVLAALAKSGKGK